MARVEQAFYEHLINSSSITDLVDERIYALKRQDKGHPNIQKELPAITYRMISGPSQHTHDGMAGLRRSRYEFNVHSENYLSDGKEIITQLKKLLGGFNGTMGSNVSVRVGAVLVEDEEDGYEEDADEYRNRLDLIFWHEEET